MLARDTTNDGGVGERYRGILEKSIQVILLKLREPDLADVTDGIFTFAEVRRDKASGTTLTFPSRWTAV